MVTLITDVGVYRGVVNYLQEEVTRLIQVSGWR
jgi:hypothetical protein